MREADTHEFKILAIYETVTFFGRGTLDEFQGGQQALLRPQGQTPKSQQNRC